MFPKPFFKLFTCKIAMTLPPEIIEPFFQFVKEDRQQSAEDQEENAGVEQGPDEPLFDKALAGPDDLIDSDDPCQRGVLDQGYDLVAHGSGDPLDDLK